MNPSLSHLPPPSSPEKEKKTKTPRSTIIGLSAVLLIGALAGCTLFSLNRTSPQGDNTETESGNASSESTPSQESGSDTIPELPEDPTVEDLRLYYEALLSQLNDTLLEERADRYMAELQYRQRIEELERALEEAEGKNTSSGSENEASQPVGGEAQQPPESHPDTDSGGSDTSNDRPSSGDHTGTSSGNDNTVSSPSSGTSNGASGDASAGNTGETPPSSTTQPSADYTYTVTNRQVTITGYKGLGGSVSIPAMIDGLPVVAIADDAFKNKGVTSVAIPDTVKTIGWFAFYGCHALEQVTIPASVTAIEYAAFEGCPSLIIYCADGSYAAAYAASFGLTYVAL